MHLDLFGGIDPDPNIVAPDLYYGYRDRVTDDDLFALFSTEN